MQRRGDSLTEAPIRGLRDGSSLQMETYIRKTQKTLDGKI
jgi:hypothetical protein